MKILFIYPNVGSQLGFNYGVAHMSSVLKQAGHSVEFWQICEDLGALPAENEFITRLSRVNPDIVGFSVVTTQWRYARRLAGWVRKALNIPIVCGGIHATIAPEEILGSGLFDYTFSGECEEAFLEFVEKSARGEAIDDVRNMGRVVSGKPKINPVRPLPDLHSLPFKDYEIFDFQKIIDAKNGWVGLMASRGCPFSCTYCFNHLMVKKYRNDLQCSFRELGYIRHFSVDQLIEEIVFLQNNYRNIRMFIFDDDLFTFRQDFVGAFSEAYRRVSRVPFVVNGHVGLFDDARARYLAEAGCRIVKFGVESGSRKIRSQIMNRHMSNEKIIRAIDRVHRYGMHSSVFIMIGLPYETRDDLMDTILLLSRAKPGRFRWTYFFPFPGTESYRISLEGGFINEDKMNALMNFTDASSMDFGEEQNLFLEKVGRVMPWFVNAYADFEVSPVYRERVNEIMRMDRKEWQKTAPTLHEEDRILSQRFQKKNQSHYAIKYNPFMGVISDYFMNED